MDNATARAHLEAFLGHRGRTVAELEAQAGEVFGRPRLVAAVGSVLQGFGNQESDVDLLVFVDAPQVTDFPVSSHVLGMPVDIAYLHTTRAQEAGSSIMDGWQPEDPRSGRDGWKRRNRDFTRLCRLTTGCVLSVEPDWASWCDSLRAAMPAYATHWWQAECLRQRTAARLFLGGHPLLAAQRYCDAGLAMLEVRAARHGETYVGPKWISAKFERAGDDELIAAYWELLDSPVTAAEATPYGDRVEKLLADLAGDPPLPDDPLIALSEATGLTRRTVRGRTLLHRFGVSALETDDPDLGATGEDGVMWRGRVSELTSDLRALVIRDLAWVSVQEPLAGGAG